MKKITFNTLKKYARNSKLTLRHRVISEFNGIYDGMGKIENPDIVLTSLYDLEKFKVSKNWLSFEYEEYNEEKTKKFTKVKLSNCCFVVEFWLIEKGFFATKPDGQITHN